MNVQSKNCQATVRKMLSLCSPSRGSLTGALLAYGNRIFGSAGSDLVRRNYQRAEITYEHERALASAAVNLEAIDVIQIPNVLRAYDKHTKAKQLARLLYPWSRAVDAYKHPWRPIEISKCGTK